MSGARSRWPGVALGDICEFKYGKSLPESARAGGEIRVLGSNGPVGFHDKAITAGPAIVIGRKGSFGEVKFWPTMCWPIDTTYYVDCSCTKVDLRWLAYRLTALDLNKLNRAAAIPGLNREDAYRQRLLLPPIREQRRIAAILDKADVLRAKRRAALAHLGALTQSIFLDMFGDPATNAKDWPEQQLESVCEALHDCPHSTPIWTNTGVVCLRTSNLTEGGWNWDDTRYVSEATYHERSKRGYVAAGDILLSREGTVGPAAIVQPGMKLCMGQRLVQVRPRLDILDPEFLLRHLLYVLQPRRIAQVMVGSTSQHLNVKELRALRTPLPPIHLQREFAGQVRLIEALKRALSSSLAEMDHLFASLQHRAYGDKL